MTALLAAGSRPCVTRVSTAYQGPTAQLLCTAQVCTSHVERDSWQPREIEGQDIAVRRTLPSLEWECDGLEIRMARSEPVTGPAQSSGDDAA